MQTPSPPRAHPDFQAAHIRAMGPWGQVGKANIRDGRGCTEEGRRCAG